jgi:hypothetical protein
MSTALEAASLVMVPSGYEDGSLASVKPTDGSGDFTFSRGSNISATRVNGDGYIEKGYENLLLQSNQFDTTWGGTGFYSLTSGQSGYDGSNDAWEFDKVAAGNNYLTQSSLTNVGVVTASVYAKAGTASGVMIYTENGYGRWNLSTGTLINSGGLPIDSNIEDIGNGWYRCSVTGTSATNYYLKVVDTSGQDTTGSIYIQDAMLNQGMVSYPYVETTTAPVAGGILEDMPRLDYSGGGSCPALLLEPQRTNLVTNSEYGFLTSNVSIDYNNAISPEGYQNAFKSTATGTSSVFTRVGNFVYYAPTTISVFLKRGNTDWLNIISSGDGNLFFNFNTQTGDFGSNVGSLVSNLKSEDYGNGWWRVSALFNHTGVADVRVYIASSGATGFANGICNVGDYFYGYGYQAEDNGAGGGSSYPTSYIPTYGTSQTRVGDSCVANSIGDLIGQEQGSIYFEFNYSHNKINDFFFSAESDANNHFKLWSLSDYKIRFWVYANSVSQFVITTSSVPSEGRHKALFTYTDNNFNFYLDGVLVGTSLTGTSPIANTLRIKNINNETLQTLIFPTALSDDECIELTTI